ncbi:hypothetical protein GCM10011511_00920 [Puia dinghuensis]|uniref:Uncharacterized protein n=1 Tax=Puia dinghuensis TaxID=1792502 RepID=A0A8J2U686_9BACT|nr:hypothetical protein GCM10011511_00920 [Puia dinghuensis]
MVEGFHKFFEDIISIAFPITAILIKKPSPGLCDRNDALFDTPKICSFPHYVAIENVVQSCVGGIEEKADNHKCY